MHPLMVSIPSFRAEDNALEKGYTVFKIEVLMCGRQHTVEKRYSEFHALHKALKKITKVPEIPSKHVRNWIPKVLEQRRHGLELYLQTIITESEVLPKIFLDFLNIRHFPSLPKTESCGSFDTESEESSKLSHQPALLFLRDPYVLPDNHVVDSVGDGEGYHARHTNLHMNFSQQGQKEPGSNLQSFTSHTTFSPHLNNDTFPNVVIEGVIHGMFYPDVQPR